MLWRHQRLRSQSSPGNRLQLPEPGWEYSGGGDMDRLEKELKEIEIW